MFPLQQSDELLYQIFSNTNQHKISQDRITGHTISVEANPIIANSMGKPRRRRKVSEMEGATSIDKGLAACDKYEKQKLHREIERQRRQDMSTLYSSLRSLLPSEYIKGKRSMSDHMNEAVNYIKHMEKKVKELDAKRDELKRVSNLASLVGSGGGTSKTLNHCFIIRPCFIGIEIMFRCGFEKQDLPLSRVLSVLIDEELPVVSCVSTKSEEYLVHTIQTEVNDPTSFNISRLQQKLPKASECQLNHGCSGKESVDIDPEFDTWMAPTPFPLKKDEMKVPELGAGIFPTWMVRSSNLYQYFNDDSIFCVGLHFLFRCCNLQAIIH